MYLFRNYPYQKILLVERSILNAYLVGVGVGWKLAKYLFKNKHQRASISIYWCLQKEKRVVEVKCKDNTCYISLQITKTACA